MKRQPGTILIIDDDADDIFFLQEALLEAGVEKVEGVRSAKHAYEYLVQCLEQNNLPKLIITDHYLLDIQGTAFISDLAIIPAYKEIPVLVISSQTSRLDYERYKKMGVIGFLIKPCTIQEYKTLAKNIQGRMLK